MSVAMAFTAVSKFVIILKDHITAYALMAMNLISVAVTLVQVRNRILMEPSS
jgi:uncharacterized membrane protein